MNDLEPKKIDGGYQPYKPQTTNGYDTDTLYQFAQSRGGAMAEVAEEIMNPRRGIFSTLTEYGMGALSGLVKVLSAGNSAVAGAISSEYTIGQAVKQGVSTSDVLFKDVGKDATGLKSFGIGTARFVTDVILDPLTYVTFGAVRGVLGVTKGASVFADANLAKRLAVREGDRAYLSVEGEDLVKRLAANKQKALDERIIKDHADKLTAKGVTGELYETEMQAVRSKLPTLAQKEALSNTLNINFVKNTMLNVAQRYPHMVETFFDQGGIKFFGKTLLSGQKISRVAEILPGLAAVNHATEPFRNKLYSLFNANYASDGSGRYTDLQLSVLQAAKDRLESRETISRQRITRVFHDLKVTEPEAKFLSAAIELNIKPADPRLADVWTRITGKEFEGVRPEVFQAKNFIEGLQRGERKNLLNAGQHVSDLPNYFKHVLVEDKDLPKKARTFINSQTPDSALFSQVSTLRTKEGKEITGFLTDVEDGMKLVVKGGKNLKLSDITDGQGMEIITKSAIDSIRDVTDQMAIAFKSTEDFKVATDGLTNSFIKNLSKIIDPEDAKVLGEDFVGMIYNESANKKIAKLMAREYDGGIHIKVGNKKVGEITNDKMQALVTKASNPNVTRNELIKELQKLTTLKGKPVKVNVGSLRNLAKDLQLHTSRMRADAFKKTVTKKQVSNMIAKLAIVTPNPKVLSEALELLTGKKDLAEDIAMALTPIQTKFLERKENLLAHTGLDKVKGSRGTLMDEEGKIYENFRATIEEAKTQGFHFEENALAVTLKASYDAVRSVTARELVEDLRQFAAPISEAPSNWRPINTKGLNVDPSSYAKYLDTTKHEQVVFDPRIAKSIEDFFGSAYNDKRPNVLLEGYDKLMNYFKASVLSIWPSFHGRNAESNVFLMYNDIGLAVFNPHTMAVTSSLMSDNQKIIRMQEAIDMGKASVQDLAPLLNRVVFTDKVTGKRWTAGELNKLLRDNVIGFNPKILGQVDQTTLFKDSKNATKSVLTPETVGGKVAKTAKRVNPLDTHNIFFETGFTAGRIIEDFSRVSLFISNLKVTGDPILASERVKHALFDYANLTDFEKDFMRRIVPFYTFMKKNLALQTKTLLSTPGRIAQQDKAVRSIGEALSGEDELTDEERELLPEWLRDGYNVVTNRNGPTISMIRTLGTPLEDVMNRFDGRDNIGVLSPLITKPVEFMTGYNFYYGKPIEDVYSASKYKYAPSFIKEAIGYTEFELTAKDGTKYTRQVALNPTAMAVFEAFPLSSRGLGEYNRYLKQETDTQKWATLLFGMATTDVNLEVERNNREKETLRDLEELLSRAGYGYTFSRFNLSKEEPQRIE